MASRSAALFVLCLVVDVVVAIPACTRRDSSAAVRQVASEVTPRAKEAGPAPAPSPAPSFVVLHTEKLAAPPTGWALPHDVSVWPSRVCSTPAGLVVENDCGCGEALLCVVTTTPDFVDLDVKTDGTFTGCTACFAMTPATCVLPPLPKERLHHVRMHGAPAFDVTTDASGRPPIGTCWQAR